ncbi:MAG: DUF2723 domain-containing protein [Paraprevotella sp.]|nr:DUF2723 domain-containing protein [Paraprevotella sp.]
MKQFKLVDNLMGWIAFAVAAFVYCSTIEPTASFWDCPEFITTAYKLEVGHPPGAPFFMLTANLFTQFVDDPTQVARMVNLMSALFSAGCILFLFWSITHLTRKLVCPAGQAMTTGKLITIEGSGLVGALVYTFSDTFWFSAVEGEVYAYSSLFTALVFWLILKWEDHADEPHSDRWLILIAYLTGLSIGVHLLNLLCLPALVLVYYYKKNPNANLKGSLLALLASVVLVAAVLYGIVPGIVKVGGWFELFFVNFLGFSFNTGLIVYIFSLIAVVLWAIWETTAQKARSRMNVAYLCTIAMLGIPFYGYGWSSLIIGIIVLAIVGFVLSRCYEGKPLISARVMNTSLLCMLMIMVGYSSYAVIVIRSTANTPMDQNSPEDIFTLGTYLNREQYGKTPLFYGPAYTSQMQLKAADGYCEPVYKEGAPVYQRVEKHTADEKDAYAVLRYDRDYQYAQNMLFPRMHSSAHARAYEDWMGGVDGKNVPYDRCGEMITVKVPSQMENLRFFISYQLNFMYWRYFLWNFAGRQNDIQGNGEIEHGNWLSGIPVLDNARLGDQDKLPSELKNNKGRNVYYCLPLLLGLIGLFWQAYKNEEGVKQFWVVFFLFFMTGIAIVLYLNQTPMQPRERDYAYAGSFYAFAIWVGMGVAALVDGLRRLKVQETLAASLVMLVCLAVPVQMAGQNWDDHDRSDRYTCRDFGQNYLQSLPQDGCPIIFTNGDNDTFPLWYNQETEGFRTDVRVCNFSYLQTDWYIDQMKRPAYDSPSVPISWSRLQYVGGTREGIQIHPGAIEAVMDFYASQGDSAAMKQALGDNPYELSNIIDRWVLNEDEDLQIIPTDSIVLTVDKEAVRRSGMMIAADSIPDVMHISLKGRRVIYKSELMMLEMLARCNWERPMYIATTVGAENYGDVGKNFVQEGLANRITPFNTEQSGKRVDSERMYDNMMNRFKFGGLDTPGIYLDETVMRMCYTHRRLFAQLVAELVREGKTDKALKALAYAEKVIPASSVPHNYQSGSLTLARTWFMLGKIAEGSKICDAVAKNSMEYLDWYLSLNERRLRNSADECMYHLYLLGDIAKAYESVDERKATEYEKALEDYEQLCYRRGIRM